jgi:hypothetical protein
MSALLRVEILALLIPIVAIVVGGIIVVAKFIINHHERMAMIDKGLHPDYPPEDDYYQKKCGGP